MRVSVRMAFFRRFYKESGYFCGARLLRRKGDSGKGDSNKNTTFQDRRDLYCPLLYAIMNPKTEACAGETRRPERCGRERGIRRAGFIDRRFWT